MKLMPDIHTITAYVADMDPDDMVKIYEHFDSEYNREMLELTVDFEDAKRLLGIFDNDWRIHRFYPDHRFQFSVEFMLLMEPLLQREDVDKIYFEVEEAE